MQIFDSKTKFGVITRLCHWLLTLLILFQLIGGTVSNFFEHPLKEQLYRIHAQVGLTTLFVTLFFLIWIYINPKREKISKRSKSYAAFVNYFSALVHFCLLACTLLIIATGIIMVQAHGNQLLFWGLFDFMIPGIQKSDSTHAQMMFYHASFAWVLLSLIIIHLLGGFKDRYFEDGDSFNAMLYPSRYKEAKK